MRSRILIVGAFHEIIELAEDNGLEIVGLIDNEKTGFYRNYKIIGKDYNAQKLSKVFKKIPIIIAPDKPILRHKLQVHYYKLGFKVTSLISNEAKISKSSVLGMGSVIQYGVNVSAECKIGDFVKLNTNCNIMHDSFIGDYSTIAPNAVILGNVKIGKLCYIGANATILPNIEICNNVIIGAGSVVTKNVLVPSTLVGIPARILKTA